MEKLANSTIIPNTPHLKPIVPECGAIMSVAVANFEKKKPENKGVAARLVDLVCVISWLRYTVGKIAFVIGVPVY